MTKREIRDVEARPARVLIVDDDPEIRHSVRLLLEDVGYKTAEASDGLAALEKIRAHVEPMVVLLDLMMPKLDGHGVLGVIAGDCHLLSRLRVVIMTAAQRTQPLAFATLLYSMRIVVVQKPFEAEDLLRIIDFAASQLPPA
jgi:CheY-like chemotaxis protein